MLREYLPALKVTAFDSLRSLFELKNMYHEDLNGILKGDLEWGKDYIGPMMMTRLIDMAKCPSNTVIKYNLSVILTITKRILFDKKNTLTGSIQRNKC